MTQTVFALNESGGAPVYNAQALRLALMPMMAVRNVAGHHIRQGVQFTDGTDLQVSVTGDDVTVQRGVALIDGPGTMQGPYMYVNDGVITMLNAVPPAHATLTRIDTVYVRAWDDQYDLEGQLKGDIVYLAGTPGSGTAPNPPGSPKATLRLAHVTVAPVTGGGGATVEGKRTFLPPQGGVQRVIDKDVDCPNPIGGTLAWETAGRLWLHNGTVWKLLQNENWTWIEIPYEPGFKTVTGNPALSYLRRDNGDVRIRGTIERTSGKLSGEIGKIGEIPGSDTFGPLRPIARYRSTGPAQHNLKGTHARWEITTGGSIELWVQCATADAVDWVEINTTITPGL